MTTKQLLDEPSHAARIFHGEAKKWIWERTVGLYFRTESGNPIIEGSGVLLRIADVAFVLTAGHVLKKYADMEISIGPMAAGSHTVKAHDGQFAYSDDVNNLDVGFIRLSESAAQKLARHKSFVRMNEIDLGTSPLCDGRYCFLGFPKKFNTPDYTTKEIDSLPFQYLGSPIILPDEGKQGVTLWLQVTRETVMLSDSASSTVEEIRMPELGGISGCGVWRLYGVDQVTRLSRWEPSWIRMVGIEHAWTRGKRVKGTFVKHAISMIGELYPDLQASIQIST